MSDNLYLKSLVMKNNAYRNIEDSKKASFLDDAYFEMACFEAQQAVEFILRAVLLEYKVTFDNTANKEKYVHIANKSNGHDLTYILQLLDTYTDFSFEKIDSLKILAPTITMWEQKGRYQTGIKTKEDTVRKILNIHEYIERSYLQLVSKKDVNSGRTDENKNVENSLNVSGDNLDTQENNERE